MALGRVLSQPEDAGEHQVAYVIWKLQPQEWAYATIERMSSNEMGNKEFLLLFDGS